MFPGIIGKTAFLAQVRPPCRGWGVSAGFPSAAAGGAVGRESSLRSRRRSGGPRAL